MPGSIPTVPVDGELPGALGLVVDEDTHEPAPNVVDRQADVFRCLKLVANRREGVEGVGMIAVETKLSRCRILFAYLRERVPQISAVLSGCRAAVNEEFASPRTELTDGATVAVLPPVSGG